MNKCFCHALWNDDVHATYLTIFGCQLIFHPRSLRFVAIYAAYLTAATGYHDSVEILVPLCIAIRQKCGFWWKEKYQVDWQRFFDRQWQTLVIGPDWKWEVPEPVGTEILTSFLCSWPLQCRCHPGFQLKRDGKTCVDIDECTTTYPCSQRCINTHGSFHCLCVDGFEVSPNDPTICKSTSGKASPECFTFCLLLTANSILKWMFSVWYSCVEEEPYLIFANRYYLRKLNLDGSNYTLIKQVRHTGSQFDLLVKFLLFTC